MQTYIFDFDGTLANSGKTGILATQAAFKDFDLPVPNENIINYFMGIPIEVSFKKMASEHTFTNNEFEKLLTVFRQYYKKFEAKNLTLFSGIKPTLRALVQQEKNLYVVSSKHSTALLRNLQELEIDKFFTGVVGSDQVTHFKPAPDGVLAVIRQHHLDPKQCVMIGDAIFDLKMGKAAGVHTCGVTWGAHDTESLRHEHPDFLLSDSTELLTI